MGRGHRYGDSHLKRPLSRKEKRAFKKRPYGKRMGSGTYKDHYGKYHKDS